MSYFPASGVADGTQYDAYGSCGVPAGGCDGPVSDPCVAPQPYACEPIGVACDPCEPVHCDPSPCYESEPVYCPPPAPAPAPVIVAPPPPPPQRQTVTRTVQDPTLIREWERVKARRGQLVWEHRKEMDLARRRRRHLRRMMSCLEDREHEVHAREASIKHLSAHGRGRQANHHRHYEEVIEGGRVVERRDLSSHSHGRTRSHADEGAPSRKDIKAIHNSYDEHRRATVVAQPTKPLRRASLNPAPFPASIGSVDWAQWEVEGGWPEGVPPPEAFRQRRHSQASAPSTVALRPRGAAGWADAVRGGVRGPVGASTVASSVGGATVDNRAPFSAVGSKPTRRQQALAARRAAVRDAESRVEHAAARARSQSAAREAGSFVGGPRAGSYLAADSWASGATAPPGHAASLWGAPPAGGARGAMVRRSGSRARSTSRGRVGASAAAVQGARGGARARAGAGVPRGVAARTRSTSPQRVQRGDPLPASTHIIPASSSLRGGCPTDFAVGDCATSGPLVVRSGANGPIRRESVPRPHPAGVAADGRWYDTSDYVGFAQPAGPPRVPGQPPRGTIRGAERDGFRSGVAVAQGARPSAAREVWGSGARRATPAEGGAEWIAPPHPAASYTTASRRVGGQVGASVLPDEDGYVPSTLSAVVPRYSDAAESAAAASRAPLQRAPMGAASSIPASFRGGSVGREGPGGIRAAPPPPPPPQAGSVASSHASV